MNHAMVATRAQAEREKEEADLQRQQTERSGVYPREVEGFNGGDGQAEEMERENESGSKKDEETEGDGIVEVRNNGGGGGGGEKVVGEESADKIFESIATRKRQTRKEKREKRRRYGYRPGTDRGPSMQMLQRRR